MLKNIKYLSIFFFVAALMWKLGGVLTHYFDPLDAKILSVVNEKKLIGSSGPGYRKSSSLLSGQSNYTSWQVVKYEYEVNNKKYQSSFYGLYLPVGRLNNVQLGEETIRVYVSNWYPRIAVLQKGSDTLVTFILVIVGVALLCIRSWLISIVKKQRA